MAQQEPASFLDEDAIRVAGINFAVVSFLNPTGPQKSSSFCVKIRGAFDTYDQASAHAQRLAKIDPLFDIYVVDCYRWLNSQPDPNIIDKKVYQDPTLNTLMQSYTEEQERAKQLFEDRKAKVMVDGLESVEEESPGTNNDQQKEDTNVA